MAGDAKLPNGPTPSDIARLRREAPRGLRMLANRVADRLVLLESSHDAARARVDVAEVMARKAEAQRDRLAELLRRTMTDTACVEVDGPGCWFCDRDDGAHTDGCEAAEALADIEKENA